MLILWNATFDGNPVAVGKLEGMKPLRLLTTSLFTIHFGKMTSQMEMMR